MLLSFIFMLFAVSSPVVWSQRGCSRDRMQQCQDALLRNIQRRINDMNRSEMSAHCVNVRDDFNCLLRETRCLTSETERNRNGDTLRNALKYIRDGCDSQGASWRDSKCYIGEAMKSCESSYPLGGSQYSSYNPETCRKFNLLQDCIMDALRSRCRSDDERFLGQYLVDTAQDLAWNCGEAKHSTSSWDRNRDDRYDRYDRNGDRDRDWDRGRGGDTYRSGSRDRGYNDRDDHYSDSYDRNRGYNRNSHNDITCCRNERCSSSRMQQCRNSLSRVLDSRISGYQDSQTCRKARDDFNCLLWQTSNCQSRNERDRDNDIFRRAKDYISRNCDSYGRWSENSCYKSSEMQRCENSFTNSRRGASYESCRAYNAFRDCMQNELERRCTQEDELFQGAYLVEKAQELAWQCSGDHYSSSGRNQYNTYDNRRDQHDYSYGRYGSNSPPQLDDDDEMCVARIKSYREQCETALNDKRKDIYTTADYEDRQKINCCSARRYRSCLYDATKRVCQADRSRVVESLMGKYGVELSSDNCRRIYDADCDKCSNLKFSFFLLFACLALVSRFFNSHLF